MKQLRGRVRHKWYYLIPWFCLLFYLILGFCATSTFNIVPNVSLPETFPKFSMVPAYYWVTNTTNQTLEGNVVKKLPANVSQVTCEPTEYPLHVEETTPALFMGVAAGFFCTDCIATGGKLKSLVADLYSDFPMVTN